MTEHRLQPSARASSLHAVDPASLSRMPIAALDELFAELEPASLAQLQGHKRGRVLAVTGFDWVPGVARSALLGFINQLPIWRGEVFEGEFGTNAWLLPGHRLEFARYLVREAPALDGSGPVIRLDYDVAANPKPLRRIVGELRILAPGLFLVRMQLMWGTRVVRASYFTLSS
ncbi:hypothetical protein [Enhygromyxa salina]|uniref:DUF4166 domain-containing protein n=1 Tax=Enhygromyxa salina TaxID=215803 RepID=A0A2S9YWV0_9BACT|nr:hypothetical protein [Enhygromyxa salina]PRQ09553.1 hypothetical protein ENSA7_06070 [Enhygromyxa salina]